MDPANKTLKSIVKWAKQEETVRVMLLVGARALKGRVDRLSDINLEIFVMEPTRFADNTDWLAAFGAIWLSVSHTEGSEVHQKAAYADGLVVECRFHPLQELNEMRDLLPSCYEPRFDVLVDKDKLARDLAKPQGKEPTPASPPENIYREAIEQFWWEAFYAFKYLWRGELWQSKHYDWQLKQRLLQALGWHAVVCEGKDNFTFTEGKHLAEWADPESYAALMTVFGRFYPADSWRALKATIQLYTRLMKAIGSQLGYPYPQDQESKFISLAKDLQANPKQS